MSTTASLSTDNDGYSLFDHKITGDFGVCNNCFARTHILHEEYDPMDLPKSLRGVVTSDVERTTSAETDYQPHLVAADSRRTVCSECGSDRSMILKRPVSKDLALDYAERLTERVEEHPELSIDDDDSLVDEIRRLKEDGTFESNGNYIYDRAFANVVSRTDD